MPVPFEFVVDGPVVSQQARSKERREAWQQDVQDAARDRWDAEPPEAGPVSVTITYFFNRVDVDVDNIPKPILDALEGLIFSDDAQVSDLLCRKRDFRDLPVVRNPPADLQDYLRESRQVVHIHVDHARNREVTF